MELKIDRQTDKQTDRQKNRQTDKLTSACHLSEIVKGKFLYNSWSASVNFKPEYQKYFGYFSVLWVL